MAAVTAIVQVFNRRQYIEQCLESLSAQTHRDLEILVVDDASTDGTSDLISELAHRDSRIQHLRFAKNRGLRRCRKETLALATAPFVAILDSDDHCHADRIRSQVAAFEHDPELVACGTRYWIQDARGFSFPIPWGPTTDFDVRWTLMFHNCWVHSSMMFRRSELVEVGGYDDRFTSGEDFELYSRLLALGRARTIARPLTTWRRHPHNMSIVEDPTLKDMYSEIVQASVRRQCQLEVPRAVARALSFYPLAHADHVSDLLEAIATLDACAKQARTWPSASQVDGAAISRQHLHALLRFWRRHHEGPHWAAVRAPWRDAVKAHDHLLDPSFVLNPTFMKPYLAGALRELW
jgi:glycosyltransferase involved in cell wall biosynthesis